jgi:hypothetical protein
MMVIVKSVVIQLSHVKIRNIMGQSAIIRVMMDRTKVVQVVV